MIFVVSLCVQLLFVHAFGASWDEPLHRNWGYMTFLALRDWNPEILALMPGNGMYYGTMFFLLNYFLSLVGIAVGLPIVAANHLGTIVAASFGISFAYLLGTLYGGKRIGFFTTFFCIFYIPFLEHAQFNPKDIPLMAAVTLASYLFLRALRSGSISYLLLAAVSMGVMVSAKIIGAFMLPAVVLTYALSVLTPKNAASICSKVGILLLCVAVAIVALYLSWPTAWLQPAIIIDSFVFFLTNEFWHGGVLFFGHLYSGTELPWYYTIFEYFSTMPVLMIVSLVIGCFVVLFSVETKWRRPDILYLVLWIDIPLSIASIPTMTHYDGMRQYFFVLPAFAILAALGAELVFVRLSHVRLISTVSWGHMLLCVLMVSFFYEAFVFHPYYASYRNEFMRAFYRATIATYHETEIYGSTLREGVAWLNEHAPRNSIVCVPTAGFLVEWYERRADLSFQCTPESTFVMAIARNRNAHSIVPEGTDPVFRVRRGSADLLSIYER